MSFQAYLDSIKAKTGKSADDFRKLAEAKRLAEGGKLRDGVKAGDIVKWLKDEFGLGHGHAMAIYAVLKDLPAASKSSGDTRSRKQPRRNAAAAVPQRDTLER